MVDRYTNAVLTVIAAALTVLAIQGTIPPSQAYTGDIQKVQICDRRNCADLYPVSVPGTVPNLNSMDWGLWVVPSRP